MIRCKIHLAIYGKVDFASINEIGALFVSHGQAFI